APVYRHVIRNFITTPDALHHLTVTTDDGDSETLATTSGHPFYVADKRAFIEAKDLAAGDRLVLSAGRSAIVTGIRIEKSGPGKSFTTYNFAVADTHTYFAGRAGVWVHNASATPCDRLARVYRVELRKQGGTKEKAFAKMLEESERMLFDKEITS